MNFQTPTDFAAESQDIERRRKYAELLQAQGMEPLQSQTAGGYVVPISPLQGLAKMLQSYVGSKGQEMATQQGKDLAGRRSQALAEALGGMPRNRLEDLNPVANDDEGNALPPAIRSTQPSIADYAQWQAKLAPLGNDAVAMGSNLIGMQQKVNEADENRLFRSQQAEETRAARMHELNMRLQDQRISAQDRAELQRQLQAERLAAQQEAARQQREFQELMRKQSAEDRTNLVRLTASMRPAPQAQIIQTPNGPATLGPGNRAIPIVGADGEPVKPTKAPKSPEAEATLRTYVAARNGLIQGLSGASTGPLIGRLPALTSAQQTAQGGVAAMAPVLKQIFRVAGEGTFTDQDQKLLMDMVPTRADDADARLAKMRNIDAIIAAKLGLEVPAIPGEAGGAWQVVR